MEKLKRNVDSPWGQAKQIKLTLLVTQMNIQFSTPNNAF